MADQEEKGMWKLTNGVYVIGSREKKDGGKINALTGIWVTRTSYEPAMVAVSIGEGRLTLDYMRQSNCFSVNVLGENQFDLVKHFGFQSGRSVDKFKDVKWHSAKTGAPILDDAAAYMDCKVVDEIKTGDHWLFIGEVVDEKTQHKEKPMAYDKNRKE